MFLSPLIRKYTMDDWLVDVVLTCKGKEYRKIIGTQPHHTEAQALAIVRNSLCSGRRSLPSEHSLARPRIIILSMTPYRRHNHPRFRRETKDLSPFDLLAKG